MKVLRTPDERFVDLVDYPFTPNYLEIDDTEGGRLRIHFVDEGPRDGKVVLLMHGQPSWSYLYRHMIPPLIFAGYRVIAPDLIGFGRSDKPVRPQDYSYARHVAWMSDWMLQLDLSDITVFLQDWGSMIGLRLVAAYPERFARVVLSNGGLVLGPISEQFAPAMRDVYESLPLVKATDLDECFRDTSGIPGFLYWRKFAAFSEEIARPSVVLDAVGNARPLSDAEKEAYDAPFPDEAYIAGVRRFPSLVPIFYDEPEVDECKVAWQALIQFSKPFLLAFADDDPVTAGGEKPFREHVKGCQGMPHRAIAGAGHFVQQDQPEQCVQAILDVMEHR
ncbi:MAG: haloalkane dehalogenase [Pseudomonadota bacterium]